MKTLIETLIETPGIHSIFCKLHWFEAPQLMIGWGATPWSQINPLLFQGWGPELHVIQQQVFSWTLAHSGDTKDVCNLESIMNASLYPARRTGQWTSCRSDSKPPRVRAQPMPWIGWDNVFSLRGNDDADQNYSRWAWVLLEQWRWPNELELLSSPLHWYHDLIAPSSVSNHSTRASAEK